MIRNLLKTAFIAIALVGCSKSEQAPAADKPLVLTGSIFYDSGSAYSGMMHYKHLSFVSATDVDMYTSYLIGEETNIYTGHLKYKIVTPATGGAIDIIVTGKDGFGDPVNDTYIYHPGNTTLKLGNATYTKLK